MSSGAQFLLGGENNEPHTDFPQLISPKNVFSQTEINCWFGEDTGSWHTSLLLALGQCCSSLKCYFSSKDLFFILFGTFIAALRSGFDSYEKIVVKVLKEACRGFWLMGRLNNRTDGIKRRTSWANNWKQWSTERKSCCKMTDKTKKRAKLFTKRFKKQTKKTVWLFLTTTYALFINYTLLNLWKKNCLKIFQDFIYFLQMFLFIRLTGNIRLQKKKR